MKRRVQLKFETLPSLWGFKERVKLNQVEIATNKLLLTCEVTPEEISLAESDYKAHVVTTSFQQPT